MAQTLVDAVAKFAADDPDWAVADALNAIDDKLPKKRIDVAVSDARALLMTSGAWGGIVLTADNPAAPVEGRSLCITVRDAMLTLQTIRSTDEATYASVVAMVDGLLGAGLITTPVHDALLAMAEAPQSWADVNMGRPVTSRDVGIARGSKA